MDQSPLARCPAEIRNRIYELVLIRSEGHYPNCRHDRFRPAISPESYKSISLPQVCRQIYQESIGIVYSMNTFHFSEQSYTTHCTDAGYDADIQCFIERIGKENSKALRSILFSGYYPVDIGYPGERAFLEQRLAGVARLSAKESVASCELASTFEIELTAGRPSAKLQLSFGDAGSLCSSISTCVQTLVERLALSPSESWRLAIGEWNLLRSHDQEDLKTFEALLEDVYKVYTAAHTSS